MRSKKELERNYLEISSYELIRTSYVVVGGESDRLLHSSSSGKNLEACW
jgi:hypothetical protein